MKKILKRIIKIVYPKLLFVRQLNVYKFKYFSESDLIFLYFNYFRSGNLMLDVGAHNGESFRPYEKLGWKVFAFEPDQNNRKKIKTLLSQTELFDYAISNKDGEEVSFYTSPESTGISSLIAFHDTHVASETKVLTKTLATFCKEKDIHNVDFLKIDTEGFDYFVLKGFPFEEITPKVILCEFEDKKSLSIGYSYRDMGNYLVKLGYFVYISEWYPIVRYGIQHKWRDISKFDNNELHDPNAWGNFIAIRKDCLDKFDFVKANYLNYLKSK